MPQSLPMRRILIFTVLGLLGLLLIWRVATVFADARRPVACDNLGYYQVNYARCDNVSDNYGPAFWFYHENYYRYVNDNMDSPRYHPAGWYTSPVFYQTPYYVSGNGGSRIDNYHVGSSAARAKFGGGGRGGSSQFGGSGHQSGSGSTGRFGGGGRSNGSSSGGRFGGGGRGHGGKP